MRGSTHAFPVPTTRIGSEEELMHEFKLSRDGGYEGTILRWGEEGYQVGKRSKYLVKVKAFQDAEFKIIGVYESVDGLAVLECLLPDGDTFRVTAPGSNYDKKQIALEHKRVLGKYLTVEYANLTKDGKPFHPVAIRIREDV